MDDLKAWLCDKGLGEHAPKFQEHGWDELSNLPDMTDCDIEMCITKRGHRVKFKKARDGLTLSCCREEVKSKETHGGKESPKQKREMFTDIPVPVSVEGVDADSRGLKTLTNNAATLVHSTTIDNVCIIEESVSANVHTDVIRRNHSLVDLVESERKEARPEHTRTDYQLPQETESQGASCEISTFVPDVELSEEKDGDTSDSESIASSAGAGLGIADDEAARDDDTSVVSEAEGICQPLTILSDIGQLSTNPVIGCPNGGSVNLTIIKHSAHTTVGVASAQLNSREDTMSPVKNLKDQMEMIADSYKKKGHLYVETKAYKELESVINDEHWVTLLGKPGDGKSTTAAHLLLKYRDKGYEPIFATSPKDWKMLISKYSGKQIVMIDDMFGSSCMDNRKVDEWMAVIENMKRIVKERKGKLLVICISRKYIYKDVESKVAKFDCFKKISTVDMTDEMYRLSQNEKAEMFVKYADEYNIERESILWRIRYTDPPHGFPHCVVMYCTNAFLRKCGIKFFNNPVKCVQRELLNFKENDRVKFLGLVLVLFNNDNLKADYFDKLIDNATDDEKKLFKTTGVSLETAVPDIKKSFDGLTNTYLKRNNDGSYSFTHHSLRENVALVYITANSSHALQLLDFQHILSFINIREADADSLNADFGIDGVVQLPLQQLARRMTFEIINGNVAGACGCKIWRDQTFINEWLNCLTCQPLNSVESIVFAHEKGHKKENGFLKYLIRYKWQSAVQSLLAHQDLRETLKGSVRLRDHLPGALCEAVLSENASDLIKALVSFGLEGYGQKYDGSIALAFCLRLNKPEYAVILMTETTIAPEYRYFHSLVQSDMKYTDFEQMCKMLFDLGIDINQSDSFGRSPLFCCVFRVPFCLSTSERLNCLIKHGADVNKFSRGGNIVAYTIKYFPFKRSSVSLLSSEILPDFLEIQAEFLPELLKIGADFQRTDDHGSNALHALYQSSQELLVLRPHTYRLLEYLLSLGISCSQCNNEGEVPLMLALKRDPGADVIQTLVNHSPPNHRNKYGEGYFHYLFGSKQISNRFCEYCEILMKSGECINQTDATGNPPIVSLIRSGSFHNPCRQIEIVRFLIDKKCNLTARDGKGRNIILKVLEEKTTGETLPLLQLFYASGLDFHQRDNDGRNALHYAFMQRITPKYDVTGFDGVVHYFDRTWTVSSSEDAVVGDVYTFLTNTVGLDPHLPDKHGVNPVMLALQNCAECSFVEELLQTSVPVQKDFKGESYLHYLNRSRASDVLFECLTTYLMEMNMDADEANLCARLPHVEHDCG